MTGPRRIIFEYEDGMTSSIAFSALPESVQLELEKMSFCSPTQLVSMNSQYVLLQWKDGWQEVASIEGENAQLIRYYVISRIEDVGRLSIETDSYWPDLHIVQRTPKEVKSALVVGRDKVYAYAFDEGVERWEGTFEAGGKKETVKFDKINKLMPNDFNEAPEAVDEIVAAVKRKLDELAVEPKDLLASDMHARIDTYRELAQSLGIRAMQRQADVYGFIEFIIKGL